MKDRLDLLARVAAAIPTPACAEVGVYRGEFAAKIREVLKPRSLLLVDPWRKWDPAEYGDKSKFTQEDWDRIHQRVLAKFPEAKVLRMVSLEAARWVPDGSLDFVYLDGNHAYEHVLADIGAWWPKVRSGGFLAGHDIDQKRVREAVFASVVGRYPVAITKDGLKSYLVAKP